MVGVKKNEEDVMLKDEVGESSDMVRELTAMKQAHSKALSPCCEACM